ncbi:hypothetical protein C8J57DRAFT_1465567 [Mycena rebaudengoi]|nr:hypothetical protein C8J57DRAFT_1465567 [Mycena rebaudengoi]
MALYTPDTYIDPVFDFWAASDAPLLPTWGTPPSAHHEPDFMPQDALITFTFSSFDGTILNSALVGPDGRQRFFITTAADATVIENSRKKRVGAVVWQPHPRVEIHSQKQSTAQWLAPASDRSGRTMIARGRRLIWMQNNGNIELLDAENDGEQEPMARIRMDPSGTKLQLSAEAISLRIVREITVSTILLISGRPID